MGQVVALDALFAGRQVWHGRAQPAPEPGNQPTGWEALDADASHQLYTNPNPQDTATNRHGRGIAL